VAYFQRAMMMDVAHIAPCSAARIPKQGSRMRINGQRVQT
jgi:hypothetical protein